MKRIILIQTFFIIIMAFGTAKASNRVTPVSEAVKLIQNSVVNIRTEKIINNNNSLFNDKLLDEFFGYSTGTKKTQSIGSGVIMSKDGVIVTNNHVVDAANKIFVMLPDNKQVEAHVIGTDATLDLAVIKLNKKVDNLIPARIGTSSDLILGETVIAIGNPYGFNSSVTIGVVSNVRRIVGDDNGFNVYIQTDALINPGNSGGPLVNLDGEVIGINTAVYKMAQGIGFAIPINIIKRSMPDFLKYGKIIKGFTGFTLQERRTVDGSYLQVTEIMKGSAAEKQGIHIGDRLISMDNIPTNTSEAYKFITSTFSAGEKIRMIIENNGSEKPMEITMEKMPLNYGLSLLSARYGVKFQEKEHVIFVENSNNKYIQKDDVIIGVNNQKIKSSKQLAELLNDSNGEDITLTLVRKNQPFNIQLRL